MRKRLIWPPFLSLCLVVCVLFAGEIRAAGEQDLISAITRVAKLAIPAVVHIDVVHRESYPNPWLPFKNDPFFRFFFDIPNMPDRIEKVMKGIGTGFLIDEKGHVITNYHVVAGATEIEILMADGKRFQALLVGTEPRTDLALLRIKKVQGLPYLKFGDSDKVEVGEWVVAIGHPRGLDHTVTQGIISAKHRTGILNPNSYQDFLQTDAAINPGNSGGPLLNLRGEVVGINSAIVSQSGGYEGIGFAIPSNIASYVAKQLISNGKVQRGWLGVVTQDLSPILAEKLGLKELYGALITDVEKDSPADKGGLKSGDVILSFGGKRVKDGADLMNLVGLCQPGRQVEVLVWRDGRQQIHKVELISDEEGAYGCKVILRSKLGADLRPLKPQERSRMGIPEDMGLAICYLEAQGPLGKAGLEEGDVILEINGATVKNPTEVARLLAQGQRGGMATILAVDHRTGKKGYVQVKVY
jgi:serine protease Do